MNVARYKHAEQRTEIRRSQRRECKTVQGYRCAKVRKNQCNVY